MIEKNVQDSTSKGQKIHVSLDPMVFSELEYLTENVTSYGLFKPSRKALLESLIVREYIATKKAESDSKHSKM